MSVNKKSNAGLIVLVLMTGMILSQPLVAGGLEPTHDETFIRPGSISLDTFNSIKTMPIAKGEPPQARRLMDVWSALKGYTCIVFKYGTVKIVSNPDLQNLSYAERIGSPPNYKLVIYVRNDLLKKFALPTRLFWLEHECAHHTLGQTMQTRFPPPDLLGREEVEADCRGIRRVQATIADDDNELVTIIKDMKRLSGGQGYPTGFQRSACLQACLAKPQKSERDIAFSCY